ncbi:hypothetical protein K461DRAFT_296924 [Myriangium duriaei CBS 260.36]|uniref:Uncharacterized protein n=1 Tax=Myriangium duriaei CBS 260.36 TaxID=1168546 RepID=A0A9P4ME11_9PEZI|nr:hypothetical protein K461DRAFT_296924 [Myriangium duriaei CBS 260.36]
MTTTEGRSATTTPTSSTTSTTTSPTTTTTTTEAIDATTTATATTEPTTTTTATITTEPTTTTTTTVMTTTSTTIITTTSSTTTAPPTTTTIPSCNMSIPMTMTNAAHKNSEDGSMYIGTFTQFCKGYGTQVNGVMPQQGFSVFGGADASLAFSSCAKSVAYYQDPSSLKVFVDLYYVTDQAFWFCYFCTETNPTTEADPLVHYGPGGANSNLQCSFGFQRTRLNSY